MAPDRIEKIEAIDAQAARIVWLAKEYVRLTEATRQPGLTEAAIREHSEAKRKAMDYYDVLKAAFAGEEVKQEGLF
jgi:hypothetical protein